MIPERPHRRTAETVVSRFRAGDDFEDLARNYSQAESKAGGGDLGFVREGKLNPPLLEKSVFSLQPGQISEPFETGAGFYIYLAGQKISSRQLNYEESKPLLKKLMASKYSEKNLESFLVQLRSRSRIQVKQENLNKLKF